MHKPENTHFPFWVLSACLGLNLLTGCVKDPIVFGPNDGLMEIASAPVPGAAVNLEIRHKGNLYDGYDSLFLILHDSVNSGQLVHQAEIDIIPRIAGLPDAKADAPCEQPLVTDPADRFPFAILFPFAGTWVLDITVRNTLKNISGVVRIPVKVDVAPRLTRYQYALPDDSSSSLVAWAPPFLDDHVGMNDMELVAFRHLPDGTWAPDSSHSFTIKPEMPSMGHSSDGNVAPVHMAKGHYLGKVNYTMIGEWTVTLGISLTVLPSPNL